MIELTERYDPAAIELVRAHWRAYERDIGVDLCFQGFEAELAALPGDYAPPRGCILGAWTGPVLAGSIALRPFAEGECEMKRLFVTREHRAAGIGRRLVVHLIDKARALGYRVMRLDTMSSMRSAKALYRSLGFREDAGRGNGGPELEYFVLEL